MIKFLSFFMKKFDVYYIKFNDYIFLIFGNV